MKIGFLQRVDVRNVKALSGVPYYMARALERNAGEVIYLGPDNSLFSRLIEKAGLAASRCTYAVFGKRLSPDHNRLLSKRLAEVFRAAIQKSDCDVIFAALASTEIAFLKTDIPIVYVTDQNWADIVDYYPGSTSLFDIAKREGEIIEALALGSCKSLIYPSAWAANTAHMHYGIAKEKIHIVPYGANMEEVPPREAALHHKLEHKVNLLWVGVDWIRKGGPVAFDCLNELRAKALDAHLTVCGCVPPPAYQSPHITVIPFLNKSNPADLKKLSQLYLDAHVFLFPTIAEALGVVLCESSAHGLPSLVRNTGGVAGAITDGENGFLLPPDAPGKDYAEKVLWMISHPLEYERMVQASRDMYEQKLNWDAWGRTLKPILEQVCAQNAKPLDPS
jgi:glycosyltransferase involved in cell wall biosynthesis